MGEWNWDVKLPINQDNVSLFQLHKMSGIYAFLNANREFLYIGQSVNVNQRIKRHFYERVHPIEKIEWVYYTLMAEEDLERYEKYLISVFLPKWNKADVPINSNFFETDGFVGYLQDHTPESIRNIFLKVDIDTIPTLSHCSVGFAAKVLKVSENEVMKKIESGDLFAFPVRGCLGPRVSAHGLARVLKQIT